MFHFDQPTPGGGCDEAFSVPLADEQDDEIPRRIVVRKSRHLSRVVVTLEELRGGLLGSIIRYDNAHGYFHSHGPDWPEPSRPIFPLDHIPKNLWIKYAMDEINACYNQWDAKIFGGISPMTISMANGFPRAGMQPTRSIVDRFVGARIFAHALSGDEDIFHRFVPGSATVNTVEVAEDGSAATFEIELYNNNVAQATVPPYRILILLSPEDMQEMKEVEKLVQSAEYRPAPPDFHCDGSFS